MDFGYQICRCACNWNDDNNIVCSEIYGQESSVCGACCPTRKPKKFDIPTLVKKRSFGSTTCNENPTSTASSRYGQSNKVNSVNNNQNDRKELHNRMSPQTRTFPVRSKILNKSKQNHPGTVTGTRTGKGTGTGTSSGTTKRTGRGKGQEEMSICKMLITLLLDKLALATSNCSEGKDDSTKERTKRIDGLDGFRLQNDLKTKYPPECGLLLDLFIEKFVTPVTDSNQKTLNCKQLGEIAEYIEKSLDGVVLMETAIREEVGTENYVESNKEPEEETKSNINTEQINKRQKLMTSREDALSKQSPVAEVNSTKNTSSQGQTREPCCSKCISPIKNQLPLSKFVKCCNECTCCVKCPREICSEKIEKVNVENSDFVDNIELKWSQEEAKQHNLTKIPAPSPNNSYNLIHDYTRPRLYKPSRNNLPLRNNCTDCICQYFNNAPNKYAGNTPKMQQQQREEEGEELRLPSSNEENLSKRGLTGTNYRSPQSAPRCKCCCKCINRNTITLVKCNGRNCCLKCPGKRNGEAKMPIIDDVEKNDSVEPDLVTTNEVQEPNDISENIQQRQEQEEEKSQEEDLERIFEMITESDLTEPFSKIEVSLDENLTKPTSKTIASANTVESEFYLGENVAQAISTETTSANYDKSEMIPDESLTKMLSDFDTRTNLNETEISSDARILDYVRKLVCKCMKQELEAIKPRGFADASTSMSYETQDNKPGKGEATSDISIPKSYNFPILEETEDSTVPDYMDTMDYNIPKHDEYTFENLLLFEEQSSDKPRENVSLTTFETSNFDREEEDDWSEWSTGLITEEYDLEETNQNFKEETSQDPSEKFVIKGSQSGLMETFLEEEYDMTPIQPDTNELAPEEINIRPMSSIEMIKLEPSTKSLYSSSKSKTDNGLSSPHGSQKLTAETNPTVPEPETEQTSNKFFDNAKTHKLLNPKLSALKITQTVSTVKNVDTADVVSKGNVRPSNKNLKNRKMAPSSKPLPASVTLPSKVICDCGNNCLTQYSRQQPPIPLEPACFLPDRCHCDTSDDSDSCCSWNVVKLSLISINCPKTSIFYLSSDRENNNNSKDLEQSCSECIIRSHDLRDPYDVTDCNACVKAIKNAIESPKKSKNDPAIYKKKNNNKMK